MAQVLTDHRVISRAESAYPWGEWFDGQVWSLTAGEDYQCTSQGMAANIYARAERQGVKVVVNCSRGGVILQVRR